MHHLAAKCLILVVCASWLQGLVVAVDTDNGQSNDGATDSFTSGLKVMYRAYQQCEKVKMGDLFTCLKLRALKFADRMLKSDSIPVMEGVSIVKSYPVSNDGSGRKLSYEPLTEVNEAALPTDPEQRQATLDEMLVERIARFFQTHSVHLDMPKFIEESRQLFDDNNVEEARKKTKKYGGILLLGGLMKGGMLAMGLKGLALLAGKALIVAKIALVLASLVGLSKLVGHGHDEKTTYEIVKHPHYSHAHTYSSSYEGGHGGHGGGGGGHYESSGHGHEHYRRSLDVPEAAMYPHLLAYRGQQQAKNQNTSA